MRATAGTVRCLVVVLAFAVLSACGSSSGPADPSPSEMTNGTVACGTKNAPPCVPIPTTRVLTSPCGDFTDQILTEALGRSVDAVTSDQGICAFTAGDLTLRFSVTVVDPYLTGITDEGDSAPSQYRVTNDRSGFWFAEGVSTASGLSYRWGIVSYGRGADTYPNTEGPEQRPIVTAAAAAFVEAAAKLRPPD